MRLTAIFARNLRLLRNRASLTQEQLADLACLDRNYIGKLEREENSPTLATIEALIVSLQIDLETLLDRDLPRRLKEGRSA